MKRTKMKHWSEGLVESMNDPDKIIYRDILTVAIADKFPKARYHYLILPREELNGISTLDRSHLPLLRHMTDVARRLEESAGVACKIGYHAIPSMQRLHLHVVSDDFVSPCLKKKIHWNSYNTDFFIPSKALVDAIERDGSVERMSNAVRDDLMAAPLKCHKCDFLPKNFPTLKEHLLSHCS